MKKLILTCVLLGATSLALANDTAKINLVKKMYREAKHQNGVAIIEKYADRSLKQAIAKETEPACLDYDVMWNSQDPDTSAKVNVSMTNNGTVKASFKQFGKRENIYYTLSCNGNSCKVSDVDNIKQCLNNL